MALPLPQQDSADAELRDSTTDERASSSSEEEEARERAGAKREGDGAAATPPPRQQMDRHSSSSSSEEDVDETAGPGRIPAEVFERDHPAAEESNKDWSMMSTDSVFGLQAAPSGDFTGFVLAHPELMDFDSTPPRASTANADADATVLVPPFESIPELPEATMNGNQSFAFPNSLIQDKRHDSLKKVQDEQPPAATTTEAVPDEPAPTQAEARQASSKTEAAPENEAVAAAAAKGGLFACFPCCS